MALFSDIDSTRTHVTCLRNKDEDLLEFIKDISQFLTTDDESRAPSEEGRPINIDRNMDPTKRNVKTSLLLDTKPINFILNPDNVIPCIQYKAESPYTKKKVPDTFLLELIEELEDFKDAEDVRPISREKFKVIQNLENSKLI